MCGVWIRTRYNQRVELKELLHPVAMLRHRGPDGYGWYADDNVAMVHTRLSVIDLAGGSQPLWSYDGRWVGIVNGELYEYEALRDELIKEGVSFKTKSDSEVLLNLYARRGTEGLKNVSGEFAFVFYNGETKTIAFGRDPFGVKPLFMDSRPASFTLASEMKALSSETPNFDPEYFNTFLARLMVPPRTSLNNVAHVWPGRVYTLNLNKRQMMWTWYQKLPIFQERNYSTSEAVERLDMELRAAVKRRLRADVEVGCYLSGGIDSALIAALAVDQDAKPTAFTVGFSDRDFDETSQAAHVARDLGIKHSVVQFTSKDFMPSLIKSIVAFENPVTNPHGAAKNLLAHHASQSVKVVLSGEGSDEWLGGYAYLRVRKLENFVARHPKLGSSALVQLLDRENGMSMGHLEGDSRAGQTAARKYFDNKSPSLFNRMIKSRLYRYVTGESLDRLVSRLCEGLAVCLREENSDYRFSAWDLDSWIGARTDLLHYIIANVGDRQEMSHSLEGRTPFLDWKVVQVAGRIQEKDLIRGLTEKYILRRVGEKYLHSLHHRRGKKPFFSPTKYFYLRENRVAVEEYVQMSRAVTPWLQWRHIDRLLESSNKRKTYWPLEGSILALRCALFSTGVLAQHLRAIATTERGCYPTPTTVDELFPFRKS
jgi:asparagine synthase (glutamine-hydrolysing)